MENILKRAEGYRRQCMIIGKSHYLAAEYAGKMHNKLGVPIVVISAIVGTAIFSTLTKDPNIYWKIGTGIVSVMVSVLAALQTFFNFSQKSENHKKAGSLYSQHRRKIDMFGIRYRSLDDIDKKKAIQELEEISNQLSQLSSETPTFDVHFMHAAIKELKKSGDLTRQRIAYLDDDLNTNKVDYPIILK